MSRPSPVTQINSFTQHTISQPTVPQDGREIDQEFAAVRAAVNGLIDWNKLIQRDDGKLANGAVGAEQLAPGLFNGIIRLVFESITDTVAPVYLVDTQEFISDGTTTSYLLSAPVTVAANLIVTVGGLVQALTSYGISGSNLTLNTPAPVGSLIEVRKFDGGTIRVDRFNGPGPNFTLSQTAPDPAWLLVTVGGITQAAVGAYSVTGTALSLSEPAPPGEIIEVRHFRTTSITATDIRTFLSTPNCCGC